MISGTPRDCPLAHVLRIALPKLSTVTSLPKDIERTSEQASMCVNIRKDADLDERNVGMAHRLARTSLFVIGS